MEAKKGLRRVQTGDTTEFDLKKLDAAQREPPKDGEAQLAPGERAKLDVDGWKMEMPDGMDLAARHGRALDEGLESHRRAQRA